jgi:hypothetical protein
VQLLSLPVLCRSLPHSQVVLAIEEEFAIEISHEDSERVNTVADAIAYISSHAHVSRPSHRIPFFLFGFDTSTGQVKWQRLHWYPK